MHFPFSHFSGSIWKKIEILAKKKTEMNEPTTIPLRSAARQTSEAVELVKGRGWYDLC